MPVYFTATLLRTSTGSANAAIDFIRQITAITAIYQPISVVL